MAKGNETFQLLCHKLDQSNIKFLSHFASMTTACLGWATVKEELTGETI